MERLTTNKSVTDMTMLELMHNNCYVDNDRNARYRDYEMEMNARDFARNLMATLTKDELPLDDAELDEEIFDNLTIDPFSDVRGLIALFYLNLCTKADLYEKLKDYEDAEEQGLLLRLPCKVGDTVYVDSAILPIIDHKIPSYFPARIVSFRFAKRNWMKIAVKAKWLHKWIDNETGPESAYIDSEKKFTISLSGIGKTVFLTESEAEAKLKEMEGESDVL
jgi:hypothetical protein|nr:MAG TPA: hypothetical protein [Caudoviricetes sp.]